MDTSKIIIGTVGGGRYTVTAPIVKEDYGLYLKIEGLELPSTYEVDFSNSENSGTSVTMIGNSDGVLIPHQFIDTGKDVFAFLYHVGADFGRTVYKFRIPNKLRPDRTDETPTPEEQSVIDQAISALNTAVAQTAQDVIDAGASAQSASADADRAEEAKTDAQNFATQAEQSATSASQSASQASASATASANSASQSAQIKDDVESMVDDAQASADASAQSATASANSASQASASATSASQSATSAQGYASQAQTSAQTASSKAQDASTSAQTASQKATEASQSASQALTYKTDAESAKTASQTAQGHAESARDSAISAKDDAESARDEAQNIVDGISAKAEQIDQNTADIASLEEDIFKPYATDSASGAIVSFTDGADDIPLKSLVVDINPIQDLHGQDAPYPAGGGKNIMPYVSKDTDSKNGITWTKNSDGSITFSGTCSAATAMTFAEFKMPAGDYLFSNVGSTFACTGGNRPGVYVRDLDNALSLAYIGFGQSANGISFSLSAETNIRFYAVFQADNVVSGVLYPMIRLSTVTDATYAPYENICPISGWTQVDVEQSGKNLFDANSFVSGRYDNADFSISSASDTRSAKIYLKAGSYTLSANGTSSINRRILNGAMSSAIRNLPMSFTLSADGWFGFSTTDLTSDFKLELGSTATPYSPYTGRTIPIDFGQTVYGGKLDVLSGELVVDDSADVYDGDERANHILTANGCRVFTLPTVGALSVTNADAEVRVKTDKLKPNSARRVVNQAVVAYQCALISGDRIAVSVPDTIEDVTAFKAWLAQNNLQVVYPLATPITIQLSPNQINSLLGVNNIWADSGDTTAEYRADTKLYIEKLTQPEEDDMIADSAITSGQFFMIGNSLYKALTAIASGATITVGTNAQRVSLADALNLINT